MSFFSFIFNFKITPVTQSFKSYFIILAEVWHQPTPQLPLSMQMKIYSKHQSLTQKSSATLNKTSYPSKAPSLCHSFQDNKLRKERSMQWQQHIPDFGAWDFRHLLHHSVWLFTTTSSSLGHGYTCSLLFRWVYTLFVFKFFGPLFRYISIWGLKYEFDHIPTFDSL